MSTICYLSEDCLPTDRKEEAIGYYYQLGQVWMVHSVYKARAVKRSTEHAAIAYLASCV